MIFDSDPYKYVVALVGEDDFFMHDDGNDDPLVFSSLVDAVHEGKKMWGVPFNNQPAIVYRILQSDIDEDNWYLDERFEAQYVLFNSIQWTRNYWFDVFRQMMLGKTGEAVQLINKHLSQDPHFHEALDLIDQHSEIFAYKITLVSVTSDKINVANRLRALLGATSREALEWVRPNVEYPVTLAELVEPKLAQRIKDEMSEMGALIRLEPVY